VVCVVETLSASGFGRLLSGAIRKVAIIA